MFELEIRAMRPPRGHVGEGLDVCFPLELEIGARGDIRGALTFKVVVATPQGLARTKEKDENVIRDRATIVLTDFSWPTLTSALKGILRKAQNESWDQSMLQLEHYLERESANLPIAVRAPRGGDLEIKTMDSADVTIDGPVPDPKDVCFQLTVTIGMHGHPAADDFQAVVATPAGLHRLRASEGVILDRMAIIAAELSWPKFHAALANIVADCNDVTWRRSVLRLERYFQWEYEGMRAPRG